MLTSVILLSLHLSGSFAAGHVSYIGGTRTDLSPGWNGVIDASDDQYLVFLAKHASFRVPYERVNRVEYGLRVSPRWIADNAQVAMFLWKPFAYPRERKHFLILSYIDEAGKQQAVLMRVAKNDIDPVLVILEARTGLQIEYHDEDTRRANKG